MSGCEDHAQYVITGQWQLNGAIDTFEICGSCAAYWLRYGKRWQVKITNLTN